MEDPKKYQVRASEIAEDSIEKCWIPLWGHIKMEEMTLYEMNVFVVVHQLDSQRADKIWNAMKSEPNSIANFINAAMLVRFQVQLDSKCLVWLSHILRSPGEAVMTFAYIKYRMHFRGIESLEFEDFCRYMFPHGYPSEESMEWLWECQKIRFVNKKDTKITSLPSTNNLLDYSKAYKSFL